MTTVTCISGQLHSQTAQDDCSHEELWILVHVGGIGHERGALEKQKKRPVSSHEGESNSAGTNTLMSSLTMLMQLSQV